MDSNLNKALSISGLRFVFKPLPYLSYDDYEANNMRLVKIIARTWDCYWELMPFSFGDVAWRISWVALGIYIGAVLERV